MAPCRMVLRCVVVVDDINCWVQSSSNDFFSLHTILIKNKTYGTRRYPHRHLMLSGMISSQCNPCGRQSTKYKSSYLFLYFVAPQGTRRDKIQSTKSIKHPTLHFELCSPTRNGLKGVSSRSPFFKNFFNMSPWSHQHSENFMPYLTTKVVPCGKTEYKIQNGVNSFFVICILSLNVCCGTTEYKTRRYLFCTVIVCCGSMWTKIEGIDVAEYRTSNTTLSIYL